MHNLDNVPLGSWNYIESLQESWKPFQLPYIIKAVAGSYSLEYPELVQCKSMYKVYSEHVSSSEFPKVDSLATTFPHNRTPTFMSLNVFPCLPACNSSVDSSK